jgi:hypothetical protein
MDADRRSAVLDVPARLPVDLTRFGFTLGA